MNQLPPLPPKLGRFDSIVDPHKAGDLDRYIEALTSNEKVINSIMEELFRLRHKYYPQLDALNRALTEAKYLKYKQEQETYGGEDGSEN